MTTDGLFTTPALSRHDGVGQGERDPERVASPTVDYIVDRLRNRLRLLVESHGLARGELLRVQHGIARLDRAGLAPSSNDFWTWTARPRAQVLVDRAGEAIDDELALMIAEIGFARPRTDGGGLGAQTLDDIDLLGRVLPLLPRSNDLDDIGWWWQRRLRRAAIIKSVPSILAGTTKDIGLNVSRTEMHLLDRAPWAHGDRLLSAFELAYAEIERLGTARVHQAQCRLRWAQGGRLALRI